MREGLWGLFRGRLANRQALLMWLAAAVFLVIVLVHVGTQPAGLSPAGSAAASHSQSFRSIAKNPVNAPHDIISLGLHKIRAGLFTQRLSSVLWCLVFAISFFSIAKSLFGRTIGLIGAAIFATTPIFLVSARQASAEIMLFAPVMVMAAYTWLCRSQTDKARALPVLIILSALSVYVPGMAWWLAGAAVFCWPKLNEAVMAVPKPRVYLSWAAGLAILAPLLLAIARNWLIIKPLLLVPSHIAPAFTTVKNIGWMALTWFVRAPFHSPLIIGRLPLLNIVQAVLLIFGVYALFQAAKNKAWALIAAMVLATLAAGFNNNLNFLILGLPAAGVLFTTGLRYLYVEWRGVFPRNPAAKFIAISLIAVLGAVQLLYGVRYAVVAWPHAVATRAAYVLK